jgi:hypothetical protein
MLALPASPPPPSCFSPHPLQALPHLYSSPFLAPSLLSSSAFFLPNIFLPHQSYPVSLRIGSSPDDRFSQRT